jgi:hypothetical protein
MAVWQLGGLWPNRFWLLTVLVMALKMAKR